MYFRRSFLASSLSLLALSACGGPPVFRYTGPEVTRIIVLKEQRKMFLMHGSTTLKDYDIDLGFTPIGHKRFEGDGKTPEGEYYINRRNPRSDFFLSIGISYPNENDIEVAKAAGRSPGGDIFIHGQPNRKSKAGDRDWTWGCIAVTNEEMAEIYSMVPTGVPISIYP